MNPVAIIEAVAIALGGHVVRPIQGADPTRHHVASATRGRIVVTLDLHKWAGLLFCYGDHALAGKVLVSLHTETGFDSSWLQMAARDVTCAPACHSIKASLDRQPTAIAADVVRRLLPGYADYLRALEPALSRVAEVKALERKRTHEVMQLLGDDPTRQKEGDNRVYTLVRGKRSIATLGPGGESVDLSLSEVPYGTALDILRLLMERYRIPEPCADLVS